MSEDFNNSSGSDMENSTEFLLENLPSVETEGGRKKRLSSLKCRAILNKVARNEWSVKPSVVESNSRRKSTNIALKSNKKHLGLKEKISYQGDEGVAKSTNQGLKEKKSLVDNRKFDSVSLEDFAEMERDMLDDDDVDITWKPPKNGDLDSDEENFSDHGAAKSKKKSTSPKKLSKRKQILKKNAEWKDGKIDPVCLQCNERFKNEIALNQHLNKTRHEQVCMEKTDYMCYTCFKFFQRFDDLERHEKFTSHTGNNDNREERQVLNSFSRKPDKDLKRPFKFRCNYCRVRFRSKEAAQQHVDQATCEKKWIKKCLCCSEHFQSKNILEAHLKRKHRDEYPLKCKHCPATFYDPHGLKGHLAKHARDKKKAQVEGIMNEKQNGESCAKNEDNLENKGENEEKRQRVLQSHIMKLQRQQRGITDEENIPIKDDLDCKQTCVVCSEQFVNYNQLRVHIKATGHMQEVEGETRYKCFTCTKYFGKFVDLEMHMDFTMHTGNKSEEEGRKVCKIETKGLSDTSRKCFYRCSFCFAKYTILEKCEDHVKRASCVSKVRKECQCCGKIFYSRNLLHAHMYQMHRYEFPLRCEICKQEFEHYSAFQFHRRTHTDKDSGYKCDQCNSTFQSQYYLKRHIQSIHMQVTIEAEGSKEQTDFKCFDCGLYFINMPSLEHHSNVESHTGNPGNSEVKLQLVEHVRGALGKRPWALYRCSRCHSTFKSSVSAEKHLEDATCKISYRKTCMICNALFTVRNVYEAHMLEYHKNEFPLKCMYCEKTFTTISGFNSHVRITHGIRSMKLPVKLEEHESFTCEICGQTYRQNTSLKHHIMAKHTKEAPYVCNYCGRAFTKNSFLQNHIRWANKFHYYTSCSFPAI